MFEGILIGIFICLTALGITVWIFSIGVPSNWAERKIDKFFGWLKWRGWL